MYKIVKKSRAIQTVVILLTLLGMMSVYPLRLWNESIPSVSNQLLAGSSDSVGSDYLLQRFIAQYDHLGTINLYLADFENGWNRDQRVDTFIFRMLDSDMQIMFEEDVDVRFTDIPGFCSVYINEDLEVGKDYYFFLQGRDGSRVWFGLEETAAAGTQYVSRLIYNYDELQGYNVIAEYNYTVPLRKNKIFLYDALLFILAALLVGAVELFYRISKKDKLITVGRAFQFTANTLVAAGTLVSIWNISIRRYFSGQLTDNIFYTAGTLLGSLLLFYAINHKRNRAEYRPAAGLVKEKWVDLLQAVCIAAAVWACCNYMNGLYEIHHRAAERQLIVFLALAAIVMGTRKEIFNKATLAYTVIAAGITLWYRSIYVDYLAMDEWDLKILRWGILAVILAGFLIVSIVTQLARRKRTGRISVWYGILLAVFFVLIIVFRNTRWWTVAMAAAFTIFYLRFGLWDKKAHFLQNICNGLLIHFVCCMVFSFVRRPFLSWVYPRFPFVFHTVTVTAVYMTFVMCAAFMKLLDRYKAVCTQKPLNRLKAVWKELVLFGASSTYMLFTASRTGFLAVAAMIAAAVILFLTGLEKGKRKSIGVLAGAAVVSVVWCFPVIFTAQRILPAVCNNVFRYEVEEFPDAITRGNEWDSMYYITVRRFTEVFNNKIFGLPESGSGAYERSEEYQKYRSKRFNNKGEVVWVGSVEDLYSEDSQGAGENAAADENSGAGGNAAADQNSGAGGNAAADENAQAAGNAQTNGDNGLAADGQTAGGVAVTQDTKLNIIGTKSEEERAAEAAEAADREQEALSGSFEEDEDEEEDTQETVVEDTSVYEKTEEYANGRMDIFKAYLGQLNLTGHDEMGALLPDGTTAVHAHNIYLQVAYDHGLVVGVLFILVGAASFIQGCIYYKRRKNEVPCAALPAVAVVAFAMAGLVEWIFHLCHPAGLVLLLVLAPLLFDMNGKKDKSNEDR